MAPRILPTVSLITAGVTGPAARHGLEAIRRSLQDRGIAFEEVAGPKAASGANLIVAALPPSEAAGSLLASAGANPPEGPETILIRRLEWNDKPSCLVMGGDDRGLMYGLLDVADRIEWAPDPASPLSEIRDADEAPFVAERSLSIYTMQKEQFEQRLHDAGYWAHYFDLLARSRFNTFTLILGYETAGYMAPPYPYFFDVPGFPQVHAVGYSSEMQSANLAALNRLIAMAHERGLDFSLAIWDHIYRAGVQGGAPFEPEVPMPYRVMGVTAENLMDYSVAALKRLFQLVPNLDAIQFRMHPESGLKRDEMAMFWDRMYEAVKTYSGGIRFDGRAKGFPDELIDMAVEKGVNLRVATKYWMEQMGLPFHPTHIHPHNQHDRRHGYADLLRYPRRYTMLWRLWNGGTTRILLWGDPEYVRRFAASTHLYGSSAYDVNEPLATKMASHNHDREPYELLAPAYRYYGWEFERYWHFFQVFGRLGYNPDTPPDVWEREFERRFGPAAGPLVMQALHLASRILPRIVAYNYPYDLFPTTRGWAEKQPMKMLPKYASALPSDTEQFLSLYDAARNRLLGSDSGKIDPLTSAAWFARISEDVLALAARAEAEMEDNGNKEFVSTMIDLRILAYLARYHSRRAHAGLGYALYQQSGDVNALDEAIAWEGEAIDAWRGIVAVADGVYARNFMMGREHVGLAGSWIDELRALENGLLELEQERADFTVTLDEEGPFVAHVPIRRAKPGEPVVVRATVATEGDLSEVLLSYRDGQATVQVAMEPLSEEYLYQGTVPVDAVRPGLAYILEAVDQEGNRVAFPEEGWEQPIEVAVSADETPPEVTHTPVTRAPIGRPLVITAKIEDPSGIKWARLRYRSVNQYLDFKSVDMAPTGQPDEYQAAVPAEDLDPQWDFMYFIEAVDAAGNGRIYPDLEVETPYVIVELIRE